MGTQTVEFLPKMDRDGFLILPHVYTPTQVENILGDLETAFQAQADEVAIRSEAGNVFAARNLLTLWPAAATVWCQAPLAEVLETLLGPRFGLVRALYFDKPPDRTWALPWHKDMTIAVRDHRGPSVSFSKPTLKAGVPHLEAPRGVLETMVAVRIHLDEVTLENGPLKVIPGSHHSGKELRLGDTPPVSILVDRGAVLLMRPLVAHSSGRSHPDTWRHRRILHLEFAASAELPDGFHWHDFRPGQVHHRHKGTRREW